MADLIAVQCPRCENQTVAGHRDCLVCGRTIHPEVDPRVHIHFCMEIRGKKVLFFKDPGPMAAFLILVIAGSGAALFFYLKDQDLSAVNPLGWAAAGLLFLAVVIVAANKLLQLKSKTRRKVLIKFDREGIHFPQYGDTLIPWNEIEETKGSGSPYFFVSRFGSMPKVSFRVKRAIDIPGKFFFWLNYNPVTRAVKLANVSIDPEFVDRAVTFFMPILTQER